MNIRDKFIVTIWLSFFAALAYVSLFPGFMPAKLAALFSVKTAFLKAITLQTILLVLFVVPMVVSQEKWAHALNAIAVVSLLPLLPILLLAYAGNVSVESFIVTAGFQIGLSIVLLFLARLRRLGKAWPAVLVVTMICLCAGAPFLAYIQMEYGGAKNQDLALLSPVMLTRHLATPNFKPDMPSDLETIPRRDGILQSVTLGHQGLFRHGEWTPFHIQFQDPSQRGTIRVRINSHMTFESPLQDGQAKLSILLPKPSGNEIEIQWQGEIIFSTLLERDRKLLWSQSIPRENRLVAVCLTLTDPIPFSEDHLRPLRAQGIHVVNVPAANLPSHATLMESVDHLVVNDLVWSQLDDSTRAMLQQWQSAHGKMTNIQDENGPGEKNFMAWLMNFESNRVVTHSQRLYNPEAYELFEWPAWHVKTKQRIILFYFSATLLMVLFAWTLPSRHPHAALLIVVIVSSGLFAIGDWRGAEWTGLKTQIPLHRERLAIMEWSSPGTDAGYTGMALESITCRREGSLLQVNSESPIKFTMLSPSDSFQPVYQVSEDGSIRLQPAPLSSHRRYLLTSKSVGSPAFGKFNSLWKNNRLMLENGCSLNFENCFLVKEGRLYPLDSLAKNSAVTLPVSQDAISWKYAFPNNEPQMRYRQRLLRYWKDNQMRAERMYWIGFSTYPESKTMEDIDSTSGDALWVQEVQR